MYAFLKYLYRPIDIKALYTNLHNKKINTMNIPFQRLLISFVGLNILTDFCIYNSPLVHCLQPSPTMYPNIKKLSP